VAGSSAHLAIDANNNGRIDDGSELFGPTSGDGFGELAALDDDGNGWVDESDAAYVKTDGKAAAQVTETGIFLREDGSASTIQHVDLIA
jgi:hypothetical protein